MKQTQIDFTSFPRPVAMRFDTPMTDVELMAFSERNQPWRFERESNGEITIMTPVGGVGSRHELYISSALHVWAEEAGTGVAFAPNVGFNLPDGSCLAPDTAWLSIARWESLTDAEQAGFLPLCPEFVVEVRSPGDPRRAAENKMQTWIDNGVQLAWLVDPIAGEVIVYRRGEPRETLERPDEVKGHPPIDGFVLRATRLWTPITNHEKS